MICFAVMVLKSQNFNDHGWGWTNKVESWMMDGKMFPNRKAAEEAMLSSFRDERKDRDGGCTLDCSTVRFKLMHNENGVYGIDLWDGDQGDCGQIKMSWRLVCLEGKL